MKRRSFLQMLAAFAGIPLLPKTAAKPPVHFIPQNSVAKSAIPVGTIQPYMGNYPPIGWLPCDGRVISPNAHPELHAIVSQNFGSRLPDMRGNELDCSDQLLGLGQIEKQNFQLFHQPQYIIRAIP
jgi:hypothetical protein